MEVDSGPDSAVQVSPSVLTQPGLSAEQQQRYLAWVATPAGQEVGSEGARLSEEVLEQPLGERKADQLRLQYFLEHQQHTDEPPAAAHVLAWLHRQLGLPVDAAGDSEYGQLAAEAAQAPALAAGGEAQLHMEQQPAMPSDGTAAAAARGRSRSYTPRRSARSDKGQQSPEFRRLFGNGRYESGTTIVAPHRIAAAEPTPRTAGQPAAAAPQAGSPGRPRGRRKT
jgi:hypothetical protein